MSGRSDTVARRATGTGVVDALKTALSKNDKVHAWQIRTVRQSGHQTYLVRTDPESERTVEGTTHEATVFVRTGDLLGNATITIAQGQDASLAKRVDDAVFMAGLGGETPWDLPRAGAMPSVEVFDRVLTGAAARETSRKIVAQWRAAVAGAQGTTPSSMELFCGGLWTTLENSAGFKAEFSSTRLSLLTIMLAKQGEKRAESISWEERRRAADLDVAEIVGRAAEEASDLTHAVLPPSGNYPVLIDAQDMVALLTPIQQNASAQTLYQKSSRFEIGKPLGIEGEGGDPITVVTSALTPYGLSSYGFDANGVPGQRVEIVQDGVFARPWATKQYADYLGVAPTGTFANLELPLGKQSFADLCAGDGPVLHVRSFSWLTPDASRGDFSSEVRVGYLYKKGKRTPVKGGTVSGNLFKALGAARFASDRVFLGAYLGPAAVRLEGLTVAGA